IQNDGDKLKKWRDEKTERAQYWRELEKTENLEEYVQEITSLVTKNKVAVAAKHTSDIADYLLAKGTEGQVDDQQTESSSAADQDHNRTMDIPEGRDVSHLSPNRVALSCTVDLSIDGLQDYFEEKFLLDPSDSFSMMSTDHGVRTLLQPLRDVSTKHDARYLLEEVRIMKGRYQEQARAKGDVLERVRLVIKPSFGTRAAKADVVSEWKAVFSLLLMDTEIYMKSGECVSEATKSVKAKLDGEFNDFGAFGRKVDLLFHMDGQELVNIEFKLEEATQTAVQVQHLKNIRLNRAIMESHATASGARPPIVVMEIQGWIGSLFALYPFEDVFVCKYLETIELPRSASGLKRFLKGSTLKVLFKFIA
ncbi:hypothetical protein BGX23_005360, partial [Mortierella sp. AD031]